MNSNYFAIVQYYSTGYVIKCICTFVFLRILTNYCLYLKSNKCLIFNIEIKDQ